MAIYADIFPESAEKKRIRFGTLYPTQEAIMERYIRWFSEIGIEDLPLVGAKKGKDARSTSRIS